MRRHVPVVISAVALVCASVTGVATEPQQPQPPAGTGAISGVVVDGQTDAPIAGAIVYLALPSGRVGQPTRELTDAKGRFVFTDLGVRTEGYFINVSKSGYVAGRYGKGVGGTPIFLRDGEWFSDARVVMYRPCSISGTVTDERGDPVVGAYVRVLMQVTIAGAPHLASGPVAKTDDRGAYRIMNLAPGKYIVSVPSVQVSAQTAAMAPLPTPVPGRLEPPPLEPSIEIDAATRVILGRYPMPRPGTDGRLQVYAPTFYPGTSAVADALPIDVANGEEQANVNLRLQPVPVVRVAGTLVGQPEAMTGYTVRLLAPGMEDLGEGAETATALAGAGGVFVFPGVPAGSYTVDVRRTVSQLTSRYSSAGAPGLMPALPSAPFPPGSVFSSISPFVAVGPEGMYLEYRVSPGDASYWGLAHVDVGREDIADLVVPMKRAVKITGRGVLESTATAPSRLLLVSAEPAGGNVSSGSPHGLFAQWAEPNTFSVEGLLPGLYYLRFGFGPGAIKSIVWNGRDMTYVPFDAAEGHDFNDVVVTFTDKKILLSGTVRDPQGQPVPGAIVVAFPVERDQWTNYGLDPTRLRSNPAGTGGTFRYQSLPAGDYFVVGLDQSQSDGWRDQKFLEAASALATRVTLEWGDTKTVDVKLVHVQVR